MSSGSKVFQCLFLKRSSLSLSVFVKRAEAGRHVDIEPLVYRVTRQTTGLSVVKRVQRHSEWRRYRLCLEVPPRNGRRMSVVSFESRIRFLSRPSRKRNLEKKRGRRSYYVRNEREEGDVGNVLIYLTYLTYAIWVIVTITSSPFDRLVA